jgi:hypothetical protein
MGMSPILLCHQAQGVSRIASVADTVKLAVPCVPAALTISE